jgi:NadR type nicotinamide-nucleotide adenylyltransferase
MEKRNEIKRVVITGPESTGKTALTKQLAKHFNAPYITEIARDYVENLNRKYTYEDVERIAFLQLIEENKAVKSQAEWLFIDTDLIITKLWFQHVYNKVPNWIEPSINSTPRYIHLLCNYDIPWVPDPVRENPDKRKYFFNQYKKEIESHQLHYAIIAGFGKDRFLNALKALKND